MDQTPKCKRTPFNHSQSALIVTTRKGLLSEASARITAPAGERIATSRSMLRVEESENGPLLPSSMMVLTALSASELCMTPELRSDDAADDIVTVCAETAASSTHRAANIKPAVSPGEKAEDRAVRRERALVKLRAVGLGMWLWLCSVTPVMLQYTVNTRNARVKRYFGGGHEGGQLRL